MWGLIQSTFVNVPLTATSLFGSKSAEIEWCPAAGCEAAVTSASPTQNSFLIRVSQSVPQLAPGRDGTVDRDNWAWPVETHGP